jgi:hypothetical protein
MSPLTERLADDRIKEALICSFDGDCMKMLLDILKSNSSGTLTKGAVSCAIFTSLF